MLLAKCKDISKIVGYKGKLVLDDEDGGKSEEVLLNIVLDEENTSGGIEEALKDISIKGIKNVMCYTITKGVGSIPESLHGMVFRLHKYNNYFDYSILDENPMGVIPLVELPSGFCDMRIVYDIAMKYPNVRFIGGNLLEIPNINIGRFDKGKEKMSAVFNGVYDYFTEVDFDNIKVKEVMSKLKTKSGTTIKKSSKSSAPKVSKPSVKDRKSESFSRLFGGSGCEF